MPAKDEDSFSEFDPLLAQEDINSSPWVGGSYEPNLNLLDRLLSIPISQGHTQQSGRPAKAFDAWTANELRRAGFLADAVWPRARRPRVLPEGLASLEERIDKLAAELAKLEAGGKRLELRALRSAISAVVNAKLGAGSASVLGEFYSKQIDVGLSSWRRGPDVLISTKTMFSSYSNNLTNRHEEAVGEVTSLRRRHPMATIGFAYLVRRDIQEEQGALAVLLDIVTRLRRPGEMFDATLLLIADWDDTDLAAGVTVEQHSAELGGGRFFADLITCVTDRTPVVEHKEARKRRDGPPVGGEPHEDAVTVTSED